MKKYLIGGINFGVINSGEGKGDGSIFVNLFCPEQGRTSEKMGTLVQMQLGHLSSIRED